MLYKYSKVHNQYEADMLFSRLVDMVIAVGLLTYTDMEMAEYVS